MNFKIMVNKTLEKLIRAKNNKKQANLLFKTVSKKLKGEKVIEETKKIYSRKVDISRKETSFYLTREEDSVLYSKAWIKLAKKAAINVIVDGKAKFFVFKKDLDKHNKKVKKLFL